MPWVVAAVAVVAAVGSYISASNQATVANGVADAKYIRGKARQRYNDAKVRMRNEAVDVTAREALNAIALNNLSSSAEEAMVKKDIQVKAIEARADIGSMANIKGLSGASIERYARKIDAEEGSALWQIDKKKQSRELANIYSVKQVREQQLGKDYSVNLVDNPSRIDVGASAMQAGIMAGVSTAANGYMNS